MKKLLLPMVFVVGCSTVPKDPLDTPKPKPPETIVTVQDLVPKTFALQGKIGMKVEYIIRCVSTYRNVLNMELELTKEEFEGLNARAGLMVTLTAMATKQHPEILKQKFEMDFKVLNHGLNKLSPNEQASYYSTAVTVCDGYYSNFVSIPDLNETTI